MNEEIGILIVEYGKAFSKVINELSRLSKGVCDDVVHFEDNLADLHNKSFSTAHFFTSEGNLTGR